MNEENFKQEFNPRKYYKIIRQLGFPKEEARIMTEFYSEKMYVPTIDMYKMRYENEKDI